MRLKSLELNGFKSFARKTNLQFGTSITAIVGPNGSGKSNTAEAFRFVLGEQSMKSMRGKRGEDLIFGGTKILPRAGRASVKLVFDNADRKFNVDFDELMIERVVHRDGVNEYLLNGTTVRLRDVAELLAQANIGASGHHIISQGEADRILSASSKERREMLEDALGLKAFLYKREEAERKLGKAEEHVAQVEGLRREIAPHLRFLEKQVKKLEEVALLRAELSERYREYLYREDLYIRNAKAELSASLAGPEESRTRIDGRIAILREDLERAEKEGQGNTELMNLERDVRTAADEREKILRDVSRIEGETAFLNRRIEELRRRAHDEQAATVPLRSVRSFLEDIGKRIQSAESASSLDVLKEIVRGVREAGERFLASVRPEDSGELPELERDMEEKQTELSRLKTRLAEAEGKEKELRGRVEAMRHEMESARKANRDAERELFALMTERSEVEQTILTLHARRDALVRTEEEFKREREEGAVLVGRDILSYETYVLSSVEALAEERSLQEERRRKLEKLKIRVEEQGAGSSEDVLKEHREVKERDEFLARELADLAASKETLNLLIAELTAALETRFSEGMEKINTAFGEFFKVMFGGGEAALSVVKEKKRRYAQDESGDEMPEEVETEEGIEITVGLPHKRVKGLHMLSGGERALTSIALIFAMSQVNPPPFLILDETDAALDEANSRRYGDMIENLSKHSQLILITHNRETMSRAGVLYGVTMGADGASKLLSVQFEEAVAVAK